MDALNLPLAASETRRRQPSVGHPGRVGRWSMPPKRNRTGQFNDFGCLGEENRPAPSDELCFTLYCSNYMSITRNMCPLLDILVAFRDFAIVLAFFQSKIAPI
jgi:hypothetical protein